VIGGDPNADGVLAFGAHSDPTDRSARCSYVTHRPRSAHLARLPSYGSEGGLSTPTNGCCRWQSRRSGGSWSALVGSVSRYGNATQTVRHNPRLARIVLNLYWMPLDRSPEAFVWAAHLAYTRLVVGGG